MIFGRLAPVASFFLPMVASAQTVAAPPQAAATTQQSTGAEPFGTHSNDVSPSPSPLAPSHWYGWEILIVDGASLAIGIKGATGREPTSTALLDASLVSYSIAPAVVHWANGRVAASFESIGVRVALPVALTYAAYALGPKCYQEGDYNSVACVPYMAGGAIVGLVAAIVIDTVYLARAPVSPAQDTSVVSHFSIAPLITSGQRGALIRATF